ncbi:hypothetical protein M2163_002111 [Streptomyces sp. SAI-135]|nr:hypothetical protein [Streptomyces sp. SAI-135]
MPPWLSVCIAFWMTGVSAMMNSSCGKASITSMIRDSTESTQPPEYPAARPATTPTTVDSTADAKPTNSEVRRP